MRRRQAHSATNTDDWQVAESDADTVIRRFGRHSVVFAHNQSPYDLPGRQSTLNQPPGSGAAPRLTPYPFHTEQCAGHERWSEAYRARRPAGRPYRAPPATRVSHRVGRLVQARLPARTISVLIETLRVETEEFVPEAEGDPRSNQHSGRKTTSRTRLNPRERSNNGIRDQTPRCQWL